MRRALRAEVYCEALVVARYENGVSSRPGELRRVQCGAELPEVLVAGRDLPEEEIDVGTDAGRRVGPQVVEPLGVLVDGVGEGLLGGRPLLDREAAERRVEPEEGVGHVLPVHGT